MLSVAAASFGQLYSLASPFALAIILVACGALSLAHYRALPELRAAHEDAYVSASDERDWPFVSIIVPARNEAHTLSTLLRSLAALDYPAYEVIVVDDASSDETGAIARQFAAEGGARWRVIAGKGPEPGWTGKNYACALGARAAVGAWLLFTDADTEHAPGSLRAVVAKARERRVGALTLFPGHRCVTFWERLLLPFAFQQYFAGVRPRALARPEGPALANGQYLLVARPAYDAAGGHAAIRGSIIDDVALAGALKRAAYPSLPCRGETLVRVRMYESLATLAEGFTKNSAQFLRAQGPAAGLVVLGTACAAALSGALIGAAISGSVVQFVGALLAYCCAAAGLLPWERSFRVPRGYALLAPLAALVFTLIALSSALHVAARRPVRWKGRAYPA